MKRDYSNSILAVTGSGGFLGKALRKFLDKSKFKEVREIRSGEFDLRDPKQVNEAIKGADYVAHMAGVTGGIDWIKRHPGDSFYDNILNIL